MGPEAELESPYLEEGGGEGGEQKERRGER